MMGLFFWLGSSSTGDHTVDLKAKKKNHFLSTKPYKMRAKRKRVPRKIEQEEVEKPEEIAAQESQDEVMLIDQSCQEQLAKLDESNQLNQIDEDLGIYFDSLREWQLMLDEVYIGLSAEAKDNYSKKGFGKCYQELNRFYQGIAEYFLSRGQTDNFEEAIWGAFSSAYHHPKMSVLMGFFRSLETEATWQLIEDLDREIDFLTTQEELSWVELYDEKERRYSEFTELVQLSIESRILAQEGGDDFAF